MKRKGKKSPVDLGELIERAREFAIDEVEDLAELEVLLEALADGVSDLLPSSPGQVEQKNSGSQSSRKKLQEELLENINILEGAIREGRYTGIALGNIDDLKSVLDDVADIVEKIASQTHGAA
jgi:hypothetical protein